MVELLKMQDPGILEEAKEDLKWMEAMQAKYDSIMCSHSWDLVDCPKKHKVIGTKWVYKAKYKANGSLDTYKAQPIAKNSA